MLDKRPLSLAWFLLQLLLRHIGFYIYGTNIAWTRKENFKGEWFRLAEVETKLIHLSWSFQWGKWTESPWYSHHCTQRWVSIQIHPLPGSGLYGQFGSLIQYTSQPKHHDYIWLSLAFLPRSFPYSASFCFFPNEPSLLSYIRGELTSRF